MLSLSQNTLLSCTYSVDTLNEGMIHILGGTQWTGPKFHDTAQNGTQFKTYMNCFFLEISL